MKKVCAWCGKDLGGEAASGGSISHGVCRDCEARLADDMDHAFRNFLDSLEEPVLLMNGEVQVYMANKAAREKLNLKLPRISTPWCGEFLECANHSELECCGTTPRCKACVLRNSVARTFEKGEPVDGALAYLDVLSPAGMKRKWFLVNTQFMAGAVLLKIAETDPPQTDSEVAREN